ncbi:hypothetical protein [Mucilaginibacter sp. NFR10]|uniref:hypothetical protein n=1 Tax=Mucilaginibacter sp. NFR10 TaxID=1566292 RepID=UPI000871913D|nr:hypothetical protein [Mucilaginibacter sp. NFR10]SCW65949.1 hypothetical protein SAMN03159284_02900 [Mucilaginibacter sp. NFR10]
MKRTTTNTYTPKPRWEKALSLNYVDPQTLESNKETLELYNSALLLVNTELMLAFPELSYERDYRQYPVQDIPGAVHCFMTKTFYWYLACDECDFFIIHYNFSDCPFEAEIRKLLQPFSNSPFTTQFKLQPNLVTAFKRISRLEDSKFFKAW